MSLFISANKCIIFQRDVLNKLRKVKQHGFDLQQRQ